MDISRIKQEVKDAAAVQRAICVRLKALTYNPWKLIETCLNIMWIMILRYVFPKIYRNHLVSTGCLCSVCKRYVTLLVRFGSNKKALSICSEECLNKADDRIKEFSERVKCACGRDPNELYMKFDVIYGADLMRVLVLYFCSAKCEKINRKGSKSNQGMPTYVRCGCGKLLNTNKKEHKKCSRCQASFYCSKECQKLGWPEHKKVCKAIE